MSLFRTASSPVPFTRERAAHRDSRLEFESVQSSSLGRKIFMSTELHSSLSEWITGHQMECELYETLGFPAANGGEAQIATTKMNSHLHVPLRLEFQCHYCKKSTVRILWWYNTSFLL